MRAQLRVGGRRGIAIAALLTIGIVGVATAGTGGGGHGGGGGGHSGGGFHGGGGAHGALSAHGWNAGRTASRYYGSGYSGRAGYYYGRGYGRSWGGRYGFFLPLLPWYCQTLWWGGVLYYYADDTYYLWNDDVGQYQVVSPPTGLPEAAAADLSPGPGDPAAASELFAYPRNGQSVQQQARDREDCRKWAAEESVKDQTAAGSDSADDALAKRQAYLRAEGACLEGRNYSVR